MKCPEIRRYPLALGEIDRETADEIHGRRQSRSMAGEQPRGDYRP